MTVRLDEQVWEDVRRRRAPDRWVVVLALVAGAAVVALAVAAVLLGLTAPRLLTNSWTASYDKATGVATYRFDMENLAHRDATIVGGEIGYDDGSPIPGVVSVSVDPVVVPAGAGTDGPPTTTVVLRARLDCAQIQPEPTYSTGPFPVFILETSSSWPKRDGVLGTSPNLYGLCHAEDGA